ncbi:MAG: hypothetical protein K6E24_05635 [bacterium]|jgi:uncharacterized protein Veg|nr:hypothetical protein [bacterium]
MTLLEIKEYIAERINHEIVIKQKISHRTIPVQYEGKIKEVYDNLFIIELNNTRLKNKLVTFNYRDILTKSIELIEKG